MLFSICTRIGGDDAIRSEIWRADEERRKQERAEAIQGKGAFLMPTTLITKMVEELVAKGMPRAKAEEIARQRADLFVTKAIEQREERG